MINKRRSQQGMARQIHLYSHTFPLNFKNINSHTVCVGPCEDKKASVTQELINTEFVVSSLPEGAARTS